MPGAVAGLQVAAAAAEDLERHGGSEIEGGVSAENEVSLHGCTEVWFWTARKLCSGRRRWRRTMRFSTW